MKTSDFFLVVGIYSICISIFPFFLDYKISPSAVLATGIFFIFVGLGMYAFNKMEDKK